MKFADVTDATLDAWLQGIEIAGILYEGGIYPAAVNDKKRTEWQDGWNAASMDQTEKACIFESTVEASREYWKAGLYLILQDVAFVRIEKEEPIKLYINCGDTFAYACADAELVPVTEWHTLARLHDDYGYDGLVAWIADRRCEEPIKPRQTEAYQEAKEQLGD